MLRRIAGWLLNLLALECGDPGCELCNPPAEHK